jgi:prefoldin subunit 5
MGEVHLDVEGLLDAVDALRATAAELREHAAAIDAVATTLEETLEALEE